jgi:hypothetical protein
VSHESLNQPIFLLGTHKSGTAGLRPNNSVPKRM